MGDDRDIRFVQKKVDESWKDQVGKEKNPAQPSEVPSPKPAFATSKAFMDLLTSLSFQAMMNLGEIPEPETHQKEINLPAAKEIIELLIAIKTKTAGNLSREETDALEALLPELQMKFSEKV